MNRHAATLSTDLDEPPAVTTAAPACYHGGAFFDAIGDDFATLERRHGIINADVLDAWYPPAPGVIETLREHLEWATRTSPPTQCEGLVRAIARARGVPPSSIVVGGGSSSLIFLALPLWLNRHSRVLLLDPSYGEYAHVLEKVVGCSVDRLRLRREECYALRAGALAQALLRGYDLVVLVNPNSPTGQHTAGGELAPVLRNSPARTRIWIDETYVEYAGPDASLEAWAATRPNVVICKSMSKIYALSGLRVAYLVAAPDVVQGLRHRTPPWAVSLPAQMAAVRALEAPGYYRKRIAQTHRMRERLAQRLSVLEGVDVVPGMANFLLLHLAIWRPEAAALIEACTAEGLHVRDAGRMSPSLGTRALRIAVKDPGANRRMLDILGRALSRSDLRPGVEAADSAGR